MPDPTKRPPEEKSSWVSAAMAASVSVVLLVFVVLHFSANDAKPLPIVDNQSKPPTPSAMDLGVAPPASSGPAPATSSIPLSAIPSAPAMVEIFVISTPVSASVMRDGQPLGFAPGPITIPSTPEKVTLQLTAAGYLPASVEVTAAAGKTFNVTMKKAPPAKRVSAP